MSVNTSHTVTELNNYISRLIGSDPSLANVWVRGEISGFKLYRQSGHMYFTLKDDSSTLACVMFKGSAESLSFVPEDGMDVLVRGSINVYSAQGRYQLYAKEMQAAGIGALFLKIEQLKKRLAAEGIFDQSRKRPIPTDARRIGIVTSQESAALRDMLRIITGRCPSASIVLAHSSVQGEDAPAELAAALRSLNTLGDIDLIIIGRGGGSLEDLMAFNSEIVVRTIAASSIPVISAVGHETDFTLADLAADLRAATPTHAAQMAVPDQQAVIKELKRLTTRLRAAADRQIQGQQEKLDRIMIKRIWQNPEQIYEAHRLELEGFKMRLSKEIAMQMNLHSRSLSAICSSLDNLSPLKTLARGYSIILDQQDRLVYRTEQVACGDSVKMRLSDGSITAVINYLEKGNRLHEKN